MLIRAALGRVGFRVSGLFIVFLAASSIRARPLSAQANCRPASGFANNLVIYIRELATETADTQLINTRIRYDLPSVPDTAVALVTDDAICGAAALAFARNVGADTLAPPPVTVVRVGPTRYVVYNGGIPAKGEFESYLIMDTEYRVITGFAG